MNKDFNTKISLLTESYPRYGFDALSMLISTGWDALCITRLHPEYVTKKFGLEGIRCLWLSTKKGKDIISPKAPGQLTKAVRGTMKGGRSTIIFLDGLEYLLMWNDMGKVVSMLREINSLIERAYAQEMIDSAFWEGLEREFVIVFCPAKGWQPPGCDLDATWDDLWNSEEYNPISAILHIKVTNES